MPSKDERTSAAIVKEYELMALSPREVYAQYEERYLNDEKNRWDETFDVWTDEALWARNEPLIKLAIARFGKNTDIAKSILDGNEKALKLAMLASFNPRVFRGSMPSCLFKESDPPRIFLKDCSDDELYELMKNSALSRELMENFFEQGKTFQEMSEYRQMQVTRCFGDSPLATLKHDERYLDGYAEYSHNKLFSAAWQFCNKVEVNKGWAIVLSSMTENLLPEGVPFNSDEAKMAVIKRWFPAGEELSDYDSEDKHKDSGYLSTWQTIRKNLAKFIYDRNIKQNSVDIALRYAFYEREWLTEDMMDEAFEKDQLTAFNAMLDNKRLWMQEGTRVKLNALAWAADKLDEQHYLDNVNKLYAYEDRFKQSNPSWWTSDKTDDSDTQKIADADLPVTRQYIYEIAEVLLTTNNQNQMKIDELAKKLKILTWVCGVTLALLLMKLA
jgi:hypothetical protein